MLILILSYATKIYGHLNKALNAPGAQQRRTVKDLEKENIVFCIHE